jgi:hypothetical protein
MANALTYRINRNTVEISLWPEPQKGYVFGLVAAGLAALALVLVFWYEAMSERGTQALVAAMLAAAGFALVLRWLVPALLWNRYGREMLQIDPVTVRIYHDYRLFRVLKVERRYQELNAVIWTDLGRQPTWLERSATHADSRHRSGWLMLEVDRERILTRVPLSVQDLEEGVLLLQRFTRQHTGPGKNLFVVHNN